ncbi:MAG: hypothetical protein EOM26_01510 [Alphaproteobacteria bacterium]|nr:hypothetical protein [Alphaproteobacteria bacterium]
MFRGASLFTALPALPVALASAMPLPALADTPEQSDGTISLYLLEENLDVTNGGKPFYAMPEFLYTRSFPAGTWSGELSTGLNINNSSGHNLTDWSDRTFKPDHLEVTLTSPGGFSITAGDFFIAPGCQFWVKGFVHGRPLIQADEAMFADCAVDDHLGMRLTQTLPAGDGSMSVSGTFSHFNPVFARQYGQDIPLQRGAFGDSWRAQVEGLRVWNMNNGTLTLGVQASRTGAAADAPKEQTHLSGHFERSLDLTPDTQAVIVGEIAHFVHFKGTQDDHTAGALIGIVTHDFSGNLSGHFAAHAVHSGYLEGGLEAGARYCISPKFCGYAALSHTIFDGKPPQTGTQFGVIYQHTFN